MTAPTITRTNTNGALNKNTGSISGTYTAASDVFDSDGVTLASGVLTIDVGFEPTYVKVINVTDRITQEWHKGMNQGDFIETAANGVRTLETDDKLVVEVDETGAAPVTIKPVYTVTVLADGTAITDNDTTVWVIWG
jgi:hypothetical protein